MNHLIPQEPSKAGTAMAVVTAILGFMSITSLDNVLRDGMYSVAILSGLLTIYLHIRESVKKKKNKE